MISRFPGDVPRVLAAAAGFWCAAYIYASLQTNNPSSTTALAYPLIPCLSACVGLGGFLLGLLVRSLLSAARVSPRRGLPVATVGLILIGAATGSGLSLGIAEARRVDESALPRVLQTSSEVERLFLSPTQAHTTVPPTEGWEIVPSSGTADIPLPGGSERLLLSGWSASFVGPSGQGSTVSVGQLSYVTRVDAAAVPAPAGPPWAVVAVNGRATSRRLLVFVVSPEGRVRHAELLERCWRFDERPLETWVLQSGEFVVLPRACGGVLAFRIRQGAREGASLPESRSTSEGSR